VRGDGAKSVGQERGRRLVGRGVRAGAPPLGVRVERARRSQQFWRRTIGDQAQSDLTVQAYCRRNSLKPATFRFWRQELARRDAESASVCKGERPDSSTALARSRIWRRHHSRRLWRLAGGPNPTMSVLPEMRRGAPGLKLPSAPRMVRPSVYIATPLCPTSSWRGERRDATAASPATPGRAMPAWWSKSSRRSRRTTVRRRPSDRASREVVEGPDPPVLAGQRPRPAGPGPRGARDRAWPGELRPDPAVWGRRGDPPGPGRPRGRPGRGPGAIRVSPRTGWPESSDRPTSEAAEARRPVATVPRRNLMDLDRGRAPSRARPGPPVLDRGRAPSGSMARVDGPDGGRQLRGARLRRRAGGPHRRGRLLRDHRRLRPWGDELMRSIAHPPRRRGGPSRFAAGRSPSSISFLVAHGFLPGSRSRPEGNNSTAASKL
jgi:hypothetical protein